jgi:hypothetical protein
MYHDEGNTKSLQLEGGDATVEAGYKNRNLAVAVRRPVLGDEIISALNQSIIKIEQNETEQQR